MIGNCTTTITTGHHNNQHPQYLLFISEHKQILKSGEQFLLFFLIGLIYVCYIQLNRKEFCVCCFLLYENKNLYLLLGGQLKPLCGLSPQNNLQITAAQSDPRLSTPGSMMEQHCALHYESIWLTDVRLLYQAYPTSRNNLDRLFHKSRKLLLVLCQ